VYILVTRLVYGFCKFELPDAVLLLDVISTDNCVFKNLDPRILRTISTGLQLAFMGGLLLVHLCRLSCRINVLGGLFLSDTPFFAKRNQDYAELASRIGYTLFYF
jgi:hypothetical protein